MHFNTPQQHQLTRWVFEDECAQFVPSVQHSPITTSLAGASDGLLLWVNMLQIKHQILWGPFLKIKGFLNWKVLIFTFQKPWEDWIAVFLNISWKCGTMDLLLQGIAVVYSKLCECSLALLDKSEVVSLKFLKKKIKKIHIHSFNAYNCVN